MAEDIKKTIKSVETKLEKLEEKQNEIDEQIALKEASIKGIDRALERLKALEEA